MLLTDTDTLLRLLVMVYPKANPVLLLLFHALPFFDVTPFLMVPSFYSLIN